MRAGLLDKDGNQWRWDDIDPIRHAALHGCSPATLAAAIRNSAGRIDVDRRMITASEAGDGTRLALLKRTVDVFEPIADTITADVGTMKHEALNHSAKDVVFETRFVSVDGRLSAKIDHAPILSCALDDDGIAHVIVDVWDLKTGGYYAAKKYHENPWGDKSEYSWQTNLAAVLMEKTPPEEARKLLWHNLSEDSPAREKIGNSKGVKISVRNVLLEWLPRDVRRTDIAESQSKHGIADPRCIVINIPRRDADEVLAYYYARINALDDALATNYAPICSPSERWESTDWRSKKVTQVRCADYCPYLAQCIAMSEAHGEQHPLTKKEEVA